MPIVLANAGVPMLALFWPLMWLGFVPIVLIEAWLGARRFALPYRKAFWPVGLANGFSTLVGLPVTWFLSALGEMAILYLASRGFLVAQEKPPLAPYEDKLVWIIPLAGLMLCVPFFVTSVYVEYVVLRWFGWDRARLHRFCWHANGLTYPLIALVWLAVCFG